MTLGQRIARLRTARGLSQGALAEMLEVSRQSVSKWETDASVPELDKLLRLAKLFDLSLDELVTGEIRTPPSPAPAKEPPRNRNRTIALALLGLTALALLVSALTGDFWVGVLLTLPVLLCGLIFLLVPRRPGLVCLWLTGFLMDVYLRYATGISWRSTRWTLLQLHMDTANPMRILVAWLMLAYLAAVPILTVRALKDGEGHIPGRRALAAGWCGFAAAAVLLHGFSAAIPGWYYGWTDWLMLAGFTAMALGTLRRRKPGTE